MIAAFNHANTVDIPDDPETAGAAKMIQKKYRDMKHLKETPGNRVKRVRAAIAIQRMWRGYLERKHFRNRQRGSSRKGARNSGTLALFIPQQQSSEISLSFRLRVWMFMEDSESSFGAKCMSLGIMSTIIFSIAAFNLQTMPELRGANAWYVVEVICTVVFSCEYAVRLSVCTLVERFDIESFSDFSAK